MLGLEIEFIGGAKWRERALTDWRGKERVLKFGILLIVLIDTMGHGTRDTGHGTVGGDTCCKFKGLAAV